MWSYEHGMLYDYAMAVFQLVCQQIRKGKRPAKVALQTNQIPDSYTHTVSSWKDT